jgi:arabinose-5-phosphate isomerase
LAHCARFNVPLIAITGKNTSTLGKAADICLVNGVSKEACPINLAPTSSTTATLALGDALAIALMHRRGFEPADFANFHPGGKLGSKLMLVSELMEKDMPLVNEETQMSEVVLQISEKRLGVVGVVGSEGQLLGVITDGDLRRQMSDDILSQNAKDVMTVAPKTIFHDVLASKAVHMMQENKITALFVLEGQKPVGVLHIHNCLQAGVI